MARIRLSLPCLLAFAAACASAPRIVFPAGPAEPAADALQIWWTATQACKGAQTFSAEIQLNGNVGGEKLRRVTLQGAMTRNGEINLLAVAPMGPPIFNLAGRAERATLTLPHDKRVLVAPAPDIVEALIGLRLTPADWLDVLSGCVTGRPASDGVRIGKALIVTLQSGGGRERLDNDGTTWHVVAGERPDLLIEYQQFDGRWPNIAKLSSRPGAAVNVVLNMTISQIFVNTPLEARVFAPPSTVGFQPMTIEELRSIGPLGAARTPSPLAGR